MARGYHKLTARRVDTLKAPGRYGDGKGLWLQVGPTGGKAWLFRYMLQGRPRWMGLGPTDLVSLADARDKATECRKLLLDGIDPIERRERAQSQARLAAATGVTFQQAAERYIAAHEAGWRNKAHRQQWSATLTAYCFPKIGSLPVASIDVGLVLACLEPIWTTKPETAVRVRGRIECVLDWAKARGYRDGENPAAWRGRLDKLLPARTRVARVKHLPALPYVEAPAFMEALRALPGVRPRCLEFVILTASRTGEALGARWSEIDPTTRVWSLQPERMKSNRPHRVPLPDRCVEILEALPREAGCDFVFIGAKKGTPVSDTSLRRVLAEMGRDDLTVHGFRSSFRDWASETTAYPGEVVEMALAHIIGSRTEAAYRRGDLLEKRRRLMDDWSKFCALPPASAAKVTPIRKAAAE